MGFRSLLKVVGYSFYIGLLTGTIALLIVINTNPLFTNPLFTLPATPSPQLSLQPSPVPIITEGPTKIGSLVSTFVARFGQPYLDDTGSASDGLYFKVPGALNISSLFISFYYNNSVAIENEPDGALIGVSYVRSILISSPSDPWNIATAGTICNSFIPTDAVYISQVRVFNGDNVHIVGVDFIYYSKALSFVFPKDIFTDANSNQIKAGMFDIQFVYNKDTNHINTCSLDLGITQTVLRSG